MSQAQDLLAEFHNQKIDIDDHRDALQAIAAEGGPVGDLIQSWLDNSEGKS